MSLRCLLGFHDWGRQENVRLAPASPPPSNCISNAIYMMTLPLVVLAEVFTGPPKECDRKCLRCGCTKTFDYDPARG